MKKLSLVAAAAAIAVSFAAPVAAQEAPVVADPFVATQGVEILPIIVVAGAAATIIAVATSSGTD